MTNAWHLAIDFGTSNTAAAHQSPMGKEISALALTHRSNILPSAVFLDSPHGAHAAADGEPTLLNGDSALARGRRDPSRLLLSPKRYIDHDEVKLAAKDLPLTKVVGSVLATVLRSGKAQHANKDPETVTLTHPEAWSAHSVDQLKRSAIAAGIPEKSLRFLSEPRAAAIHYASQQSVRAGSHVAVFDFGGGTLDIAVLEAKSNGNFEVVAAKGDNSLGGRTIDNLMYRWVLDQLEHDDPDLADYLRSAPIATVHALESSIREAKEILSDTSSATISVSTPHGETDLLITRDEFNNVIEQSIMRGVELTRAALAQAGVDSTKTPIYMTGGSSRVPFVQDRLGEVGTVMTLDDPKTVVSRGALAATLRGFTDGGLRILRTVPRTRAVLPQVWRALRVPQVPRVPPLEAGLQLEVPPAPPRLPRPECRGQTRTEARRPVASRILRRTTRSRLAALRRHRPSAQVPLALMVPATLLRPALRLPRRGGRSRTPR